MLNVALLQIDRPRRCTATSSKTMAGDVDRDGVVGATGFSPDSPPFR
jgi:hypothetical protein